MRVRGTKTSLESFENLSSRRLSFRNSSFRPVCTSFKCTKIGKCVNVCEAEKDKERSRTKIKLRDTYLS